MKQEILDSYKAVFEELSKQYKEIEQQIKEEATVDVSAFMFENRFDESQVAVGYLKNLLHDIKFDIDFSAIEKSIKEYNRNMKLLRSNTQPFFVPTLTPEEEPSTKQVSSSEAFNNSTDNKKQGTETESFLTFVQKTLPNHKFNILKVEENDIELEKNKKHYYLTVTNKALGKSDYIKILERLNEKKNIGFICESDETMKQAQSFANEWVQNSPEYKTKFLSIHFTTKERLQTQSANVFETYSY